MGRLVISVQCTIDGSIDRIPEWLEPDASDDGSFGQLQAPMTKYVASRSPDRSKPLPWKGRWLDGELAESVYGCGMLAYALVSEDLVDELRVWVHPVVCGGGGQRSFLDHGVRMEVLSTTSYASGVVRISGRPRAVRVD